MCSGINPSYHDLQNIMTLAEFGSEVLSAWMGSVNDGNCWEEVHVLISECTSQCGEVNVLHSHIQCVNYSPAVCRSLLQYCKNSPFPQENQVTFPKTKAYAKTLYRLLSITQTSKWAQEPSLRSDLLSTQWFPNKISCVAYAAKTIATD